MWFYDRTENSSNSRSTAFNEVHPSSFTAHWTLLFSIPSVPAVTRAVVSAAFCPPVEPLNCFGRPQISNRYDARLSPWKSGEQRSWAVRLTWSTSELFDVELWFRSNGVFSSWLKSQSSRFSSDWIIEREISHSLRLTKGLERTKLCSYLVGSYRFQYDIFDLPTRTPVWRGR